MVPHGDTYDAVEFFLYGTENVMPALVAGLIRQAFSGGRRIGEDIAASNAVPRPDPHRRHSGMEGSW